MKQYSEAFIEFDTAKNKHAVAIADVGVRNGALIHSHRGGRSGGVLR